MHSLDVVKDPHEVGHLEGISDYEFHQRVSTDRGFAARCIEYSLDMSEEKYAKVPQDVKDFLIDELMQHGKDVVAMLRHPVMTRVMMFLHRFDRTFANPAKYIGYGFMSVMAAFWVRVVVVGLAHMFGL